jgi:mannose-6-phosphate isomerase-like protein (cupin superfamily)
MSDYTVVRLEEAPDVLGDYPGEMRMLAGPLECEQVAFTWRRMPAGTGGKGGYGHRHRTQEEVYFVASGTLEFKLEDEVREIGAGTAIRVAPGTVRSVWNEGPEDAVVVIVSNRSAAPEGDHELVDGFWPADR